MTNDPASTEYQENIEDELNALLLGVSTAALAVLARRLKDIGERNLTYAEVYKLIPEDMKEMSASLAQGKIATAVLIDRVFSEMADGNDKWAAKSYEARGREQRKWRDNATMSGLIQAGKEAAKGVTGDLINTKVDGIIDSKGKFHQLDKYYKEKVAEGVRSLLSGSESYQQTVGNTIKEIANSNLRVKYSPYNEAGDYITRELYAAVRTNVMDSYRQSLSEMRMAQGLEFGADGVEISAHACCADDHLPYQGEEYTKKKFEKIQNGLKRPLVIGANCRHIVFPIIYGINSRTYSKKELAKMREFSTKKVSFEGIGGRTLTMTRYNASQYQRGIEQRLRQLNAQKYLANEAGVTDSKLNGQIRDLTSYYKGMSKSVGLTTRMERTKAYMAY